MLLPLVSTEPNEEMGICRIIMADVEDAVIGYKQNTERRWYSAESIHKGYTEEIAFGLNFWV